MLPASTFPPTTHVSRRTPQSLTLRALGVATHFVKASIFRACVFYFTAASLFAADEPKHNAMFGKAGVVRKEATAIKIAVAVWEPIYGADNIARQTPFHAPVKDGVWTVTGSLPKHMVGGVALAEIAKTDGRILRISHGK